jgi:hypothetical protein
MHFTSGDQSLAPTDMIVYMNHVATIEIQQIT